jgi:hypothetical protein
MRRRRAPAADPFRILGLKPSPDLADSDVRAAWRRAASAMHPDREDGGDPERFATAAAAYTALRTRSGRREALAGLGIGVVPPPAPEASGPRPVLARYPGGLPGAAARLAGRARRGRRLRLALRILAAAAASTAAVAAAGCHPAAPALVTGAATWLILTARHDLAPPS